MGRREVCAASSACRSATLPAGAAAITPGSAAARAMRSGVDRHGPLASTGLHRDPIAAIFKTTQAALNGSSERANARTTRHVVFAALHPSG
jgi:hypothetical protein